VFGTPVHGVGVLPKGKHIFRRWWVSGCLHFGAEAPTGSGSFFAGGVGAGAVLSGGKG